MTKKKITVEVASLGIEYCTAERIVELLTGYIKQHGAGNVTFEKTSYRYDGGEYIAVMAAREETDEEYAMRLIEEKLYFDQNIVREKAEFERLKKKFV